MNRRNKNLALVRILELAKCHRDLALTNTEFERWQRIVTIAYDALGEPSAAKIEEIKQKATEA